MENARDINPFGLRLPADLRAKLETAAQLAGRSLNAEIVFRLSGSFGEDETKARIERMEAAMREHGLFGTDRMLPVFSRKPKKPGK